MTQQKNYTVYNVSVANELIRMGFPMSGVEQSWKTPGKSVYLFQDTAELRVTVNTLAANIRKTYQDGAATDRTPSASV